MQLLARISLALGMFLLAGSGCASIGPYRSATPNQDIHAAAPDGMTRVIFYNPVYSGLLKLNMGVKIEINGHAGPFIQHSHYFQVFLPPGTHVVKLEHVDPFAFSNTYEIEVGRTDLFVKVGRKFAGNVLLIMDQLPTDFEQLFRPAVYP